MGVRLSHTTVSALDPCAQARWWHRLLGWPLGGQCRPGDTECWLESPEGFRLLFFSEGVREPKGPAWNRLHLDLRPDEGGTCEEEVARAVELGAEVVDDRRGTDSWVVLADPEGNEFCILGA
ncbi:VOC family protein [Kocuria turfanensis]|uniref:VOC family protein n=1 Tax=Kocuria turfanensis TaxID=388357 RepID=UPI0040370536